MANSIILHFDIFILHLREHHTQCDANAFSPTKDLYIPKDFINHAASLHQTFVHCGRFSTAATRRCMVRVSVPSVGVRLSPPLNVIALVSHYLTN